MKLFLFLLATLVAKSLSQDLEHNEPSLCVEHKNPFSYAHCIKKRNTDCENGEFCGTCNKNSCQTCQGNTCRTSCNGIDCQQCPSGDCCSNQNCNICSGKKCCVSTECNSCTNSCNSGCSTAACRSACINVCDSISINCCCKWEEHSCFKMCRNRCRGDHCYETCFKTCNCEKPCTTDPTPEKESYTTTPNNGFTKHPGHTTINNTSNISPVNITTIVNVKNYVLNRNYINNPLNITNINHNHIHTSSSSNTSNVNKTISSKEPPKDKCCYVVHPVHCFNIESPPYIKCQQKRHWECSDICTSVVIHLVRVKETISSVGMHPCIYQSTPPYVRCSNPSTSTTIIPQNCGSCYYCGNQYNPPVCRTYVTCSNLCRGGIVYSNSQTDPNIIQYAPYYSSTNQNVQDVSQQYVQTYPEQYVQTNPQQYAQAQPQQYVQSGQ